MAPGGRLPAARGQLTDSSCLTMFNAACDAWNFTCSRPPGNRKRLTAVPDGAATATTTVPTGFWPACRRQVRRCP